ncbi:MarR family winged helix-turn-helix transcriptional regulator [Streptomonospora wellingtoniae]|uniref:MarR family winged helix-turn-helix transcriptional regulator n=1 Tax=Streptomonospora wellingtoniae TaxID=3075544 RepID=A0ABU2KN64_9ACTN|nr:MarR family winged helix-turn-helix transcriptional regulator [Streptomonospora sp. DSM 45055]MDT0300671.1 MarR family winged helix-turn-helix transcriptional regulator [Streptomonospora sp. DSM 45055]
MDGGEYFEDARLPDAEPVEGVLRFVPLLESYYRRAHDEMPEELQRTFRRHRLTGRHGGVLVQLVHGRELTVTELAERLGVRLSTASELVGDLASVALVVRRPDPGDRRRVLVALGPDYQEPMERFMAARAAPLLRVLERLSPSEQQGFAAGLEAWAREVNGQSAPEPPSIL